MGRDACVPCIEQGEKNHKSHIAQKRKSRISSGFKLEPYRKEEDMGFLSRKGEQKGVKGNKGNQEKK